MTSSIQLHTPSTILVQSLYRTLLVSSLKANFHFSCPTPNFSTSHGPCVLALVHVPFLRCKVLTGHWLYPHLLGHSLQSSVPVANGVQDESGIRQCTSSSHYNPIISAGLPELICRPDGRLHQSVNKNFTCVRHND